MEEEDNYREELEYEEIEKYTNNKSENMLITKFQFGSVYRGKNGDREFTVKFWDNDDNTTLGRGKQMEEFYLRSVIKIKGILRWIYFCDSDGFTRAMVYDLYSLDTVHNLIPKDNFTWPQRIKVCLGFASILRSLHKYGRNRHRYIVCNVDAAHVMCDQDYNPILYDFGMCIRNKPSGSSCYTDPYVTDDRGKCTTKTDVFGYGVILLSLITKRIFNSEMDSDLYLANKWAEKEYKHMIMQGQTRPSLVNGTLKTSQYYYPSDGRMITELAMQCILYLPDNRPKMKRVVDVLKSLKVVGKCSDISSAEGMGAS